MNFATKAAAGAAGIGGVTGGGILASQHLSKGEQKPTLSQILQKEGFEPMKDEDSQWTTTLQKYNEVKGSADEIFKSSTVELTVPQLKEQCNSLLTKDLYSEIEKAKTIRWCTKPISINDRIGKFGRRVLNDEDNSATDKTLWTNLVKKHLQDSSGNRLGVTINALTGNAEVDNDRINILRGECKKLKVKTSLDKDYLSDYSKFQDWCSVPKETNGN
ncbi:hypothetical protein HF1_04130 [Mycoplasma haemofelis str. Langford 1]|uniref:Uncharacterized protein n=1 Tax=Mycoplasma haemofelis (strain Langford 1) TaxID=941640 RepID=E8ZH00_MYCHL|nr:hypothetical protein [Mycoplasma haemofelis]CBY92421.1 hypothetical protein HF1_04130 [Mycoplasma haemofelis str. Langford 1]